MGSLEHVIDKGQNVNRNTTIKVTIKAIQGDRAIELCGPKSVVLGLRLKWSS